MPITPVEIRHVQLGRAPLGYRRGAVDRLHEEIAASFEEVWRDRADLEDRVEQLEAELVRYRELEALLRATLVTAERAATELKDQARREAELILSEAHGEARSITREATARREALLGETRRVRALLRSALMSVDAVEPAEQPRDAEAA
ncbi:MAG: DivIVA domain-containing protein [Actinomycetota bacterium]|nr:DivIVA domain-containing protein [Actinomycetota bacterium]